MQDTVRIKADHPPVWGPSATLTHAFSIGEVDGPQEYAFGRIYQAAVAPDGGFYLYDDNDVQIRRYDAKGVFLNRIGRRGGGPGEYSVVAALEVMRDGSLVVFDPRQLRITYFHSDGKVRHEISNVRAADYGDFIVDSAGLHYLSIRLPGPREGPGARHQYVRLSSGGAALDSILHPPQTERLGTGFGLSTSDGMRNNFAAQTVVGPYRFGGMLTAQTQDYRFTVIRPGKPTLVVTRVHRRLPLAPKEEEEWKAFADYLQPHSLHKATRHVVPGTKPALRDLFSDNSGRIWVHLYVPAEKHVDPWKPKLPDRPRLTWRERNTFDVFSPEGRYLGRLQLPWESKILAIGGERVLVLSKGDEGQDRVVVYQLPSGVAPATARSPSR